MPTNDDVRQAREYNDKLREQIVAKQAEHRRLAEEANNEYRMQRYAREREELERQLAALDESPPAAVPQAFDDTQTFSDTHEAAAPVTAAPSTTAKPPKAASSTPTDVAVVNPQE
jgi:hypothetical protein